MGLVKVGWTKAVCFWWWGKRDRGLYDLQRKVVEGQIGEEGEEWHFDELVGWFAWVDDGIEGTIFRCWRVEKW